MSGSSPADTSDPTEITASTADAPIPAPEAIPEAMPEPIPETTPEPAASADATSGAAEQDPPSATAVADYLAAHEDFFQHHKTLLANLKLPHESGKTISLVERQVGILRERNMDMRRRLNALVQTARDNDALFTKTRTLTLALLDCASLPELNEVLATHVLVDFEADFVCCHLAGAADPGPLDHIRHTQGIEFAHLLGPAQASCTPLRASEMQIAFPTSVAEEPTVQTTAGSAVLIQLELAQGEAILAIGSSDANRFSNEMDTLFVTYIADVLAKVIQPMLATNN